MTEFKDEDFKDVQTHDGFVSRDKDFSAILEEMTVQPIGKNDTLALSLRFDDDPEGEKLINIFGIDRDKDGSYNKKMGFGAFLESLKAIKVMPQIAKKQKEGTNQENPDYQYAFRTSPPIIGKRITCHLDVQKYTKDNQEKSSQVWTIAKIEDSGAPQQAAPGQPTNGNGNAVIEQWRQLICDPEKVKALGLPGSLKNIISNLKKVVPDVKQVEVMQKMRQQAIDTMISEGLIKIENGIIIPI